jgi:carotenoid cleavage dioxygenase
MTIHLEPKVKSSLKPTIHPYLTGAWKPSLNEYTATDMEVIGEIPKDIDGVYVRNTENPVHQAKGNYHPFDGDGMLHSVTIRNGQAEYRNRFVRTKGFEAEQIAGQSLWQGIANFVTAETRKGWGAQGFVKDSSSTDVVIHAGKIMSTFWQCGEGYLLDPYTLENLGTQDWVPEDGISAHPKVDLNTGEMLFFNYSNKPPYQHYGVVDKDNKLVHYTPIPLPGPRLPHDMAFSKNYAILADLPLFFDPDKIPQNKFRPRYHPDMPTRFAIFPRYGTEKDVIWFEAKPTYVLHWLNAYEEGDEVILDGYFQDQPNPPPLKWMPRRIGKVMASIDLKSLQTRLHRWHFNLKTGEVREYHLSDEIVEFGTFNQRYAGSKNRYYYSVWNKPGWFLFSGIMKHDLETGEVQKYDFGKKRYGSEAPFVPRIGAKDEDDGYLISFITDMKKNRSECVILDAKNIEAGPVCQIILPHRISSGTHACWANGEEIQPYLTAGV